MGGRAYVSKDPVGYAVQTLEAALLRAGGHPPRLIFEDPRLSILEYAPALASLPHRHDRLAAVESLLKAAKTNDRYRSYITSKLPMLISLMPLWDKVGILNTVLSDRAWKRAKVRAAMAFAVVRSARDLVEMKGLVSSSRAPLLFKLPHKELREIVAKTVIMRSFSKLAIPTGLAQRYSAKAVSNPREARGRVKAKLLELHGAVVEHLKVLDAFKNMASLRSAREFRRSLKEALKVLQPVIARPGALPEHRLSRFHGAQLANFLSLKLRTELSQGVWLTRRTLPSGEKTRAWTAREIRNLGQDLRLVSEGHLLMTPLLHRFERYSSPHWGERHWSGAIRLSDRGRVDRDLSSDCGGIRVSRVVLLHEVGHALQMGANVEPTAWNKSGEVQQPSDPLFDFPAFCRLSEWRVISEPWQLEHNRNAVRVNGVLHLLHHPTKLNGELVTLCLAEHPPEPTLLMSYRPGSTFAVSAASPEPDPFEWWADGFMEYVTLPERLSEIAPEHFLYFHLHFRKYPEESDLVQEVYRRLWAQRP